MLVAQLGTLRFDRGAVAMWNRSVRSRVSALSTQRLLPYADTELPSLVKADAVDQVYETGVGANWIKDGMDFEELQNI